MSSALTPVKHGNAPDINPEVKTQYVTAKIDNQLFAIPVTHVRDIIGKQEITRIPLSPAECAGALNLRGRIITAFDVRKHLGLKPRKAGMAVMNIVVECADELYSLIIDEIGEVLDLPLSDFESNPATLDENWKQFSKGIFRLENQLIVHLDIDGLLSSSRLDAIPESTKH